MVVPKTAHDDGGEATATHSGVGVKFVYLLSFVVFVCFVSFFSGNLLLVKKNLYIFSISKGKSEMHQFESVPRKISQHAKQNK